MLKQKVAQYILRERLFGKADKLLVALSGGADSVALLRVLLDLGYTCEAAHCNFHLRGAESDRDERFVRDLCDSFHIRLHVVHFQTEKIAKERKISIEMAARELRYEWFEALRQETGAAFVCVAHHQDDSVETFLLNLLRGTGIQGLRGIPTKNGSIVRPLLCVSRTEILDYLRHLKQDFVTDSTNLQSQYLRNKVRLELLPLMESINPAAKEHIAEAAQHLRDIHLIYNIGVEEAKKRVLTSEGIGIEALKREPAPETLLHEMLAPLGFHTTQVHEVMQALDAQPGKLFLSPTHVVLKDREQLLISERKAAEKPALHMEEIERTPDFRIPKEKNVACLDAAKLHAPLSLRLAKEGDWFVPFGMKGRKNLSDYMTDRKFSLIQKQNQWVLCCGEDIVWLVNERPDNRFCVDESTKKILFVKNI